MSQKIKQRKKAQLKAWPCSNSENKTSKQEERKIANIPFAHHLSCNVLSSAERKKSGLNKVKIYTQLVMVNIFQNKKLFIIEQAPPLEFVLYRWTLFCIPLVRAHQNKPSTTDTK